MKPVILGKPRSQPKKALMRAQTEQELASLMSGVEKDIASFYGLTLSGTNLVTAIFNGIRDPRYFKFARGQTDSEFDGGRYPAWLAFRQQHPAVSTGDEYCKVKWGDNWKAHRDEYGANKANPYEVQHWIDKGLSEEEAAARVSKLKRDTSMPLDRWIELYGEEEGKKRHAKQHRFHLNWDEAWDGDLKSKQQYTRETNRCTVEHWIKRGFTAQEAQLKVSEVQKKYSGLHKEFWRAKGLSEAQIEEIWVIISQKKDSSSRKFFIDKYGEKGEELYLQNCLIKSSCYRKHGKLAEELYPGLRGYVLSVANATNRSVLKLPPCPGRRGRNKNDWQLDHKFSVIEGYRQSIPPAIIGHHKNLEWILADVNNHKKDKCSITLEELMKAINEDN